MTRRRLLMRGSAGALGIMSVGALLAACGDEDSSTTSAPTTSAAEPATSAAAAETTTAAGESSAAATTSASGGGGGTLRLGVSDMQAEDSLDPAIALTSVGTMGGFMIYDSLLRANAAWELEPMLAQDWDVSADGTEWSFRLRDGVLFHDGSPFTSADVVWQFTRVLDEATGSAGLSILSTVLDPSGISAPDPTTVRFKLKAPDAFFGVKTAHYTLRIPKAETSDWLSASFGTGPFKSVSFRPGEGFEFERNPDYWMEGLPLLDGIVAVGIAEQATRAEAVLSGDVDVADRPSVSAIPQFQENDDVDLFPTDPQAYTFDIDSSIKPFSDPRVSQAMKMLIDRQAMMNLVVRGFGTVSADSLIHPKNALYPTDLEPYPFDPERAKALLKEAGYEAGFTEKAWTTTAYTYLNEGAAFGKEAWAQADINLEIESVSNDRYLQAFLNEPIVMDYYNAQHPVTMFELYYASTSESNTARYRDPEVDDWLAQLKATTDTSLQAELAGSIIKRYNERAALICPFHFDDLVPHKKRVTGLEAVPLARLDFRRVAITS